MVPCKKQGGWIEVCSVERRLDQNLLGSSVFPHEAVPGELEYFEDGPKIMSTLNNNGHLLVVGQVDHSPFLLPEPTAHNTSDQILRTDIPLFALILDDDLLLFAFHTVLWRRIQACHGTDLAVKVQAAC